MTRPLCLITAAALCLCACAEIREHQSPHARYQAYGKTWTYYSVERYAKRWGFDTPHGIMGWRETLEQFPYLVTDDGKTIPIHERLYALQRDGSYKPVRCCSSPLINVSVRNFEGRLIAYFKQIQEETTNCFVHPEGEPNYDEDREKRRLHVQFFGEFDPEANYFGSVSSYQRSRGKNFGTRSVPEAA
jgi:hypothetical protein